MKHHRYLSIPAILLIALTIFVSCQESPEVSLLDTNEQVSLQTEMESARNLIERQIEDNLSNFPENARSENESWDVYFTLIGADNETGDVLYATWNDNVQGYVPVTEDEVTATVRPNSLCFWVKARGLSALNAIEFDEPSNAIIGQGNTVELLDDLLWVTFFGPAIPDNTTLKYDIVYDCAGDGQGPIRLDPKIKVDGDL